MIDRILRTDGRPRGCVVCLPGNGDRGRDLADVYRVAVPRSLVVGVTPRGPWFPGGDPVETTRGMNRSVAAVERVLRRLHKAFGVVRERTALVAFGEGVAVALEMVIRSRWPFAAVVGHSGFVLEPGHVPPASADTLISLFHCKDDPVIDHDARFVPTRLALERQRYNVMSCVRVAGGHALFKDDIRDSGPRLERVLG